MENPRHSNQSRRVLERTRSQILPRGCCVTKPGYPTMSNNTTPEVGENSRVDMDQIPAGSQGEILEKRCGYCSKRRPKHEFEPDFATCAPCRTERREKAKILCYRCRKRSPRTIVAGLDQVETRTCDSCFDRMNLQRAKAIELGNCSRCRMRPAKQSRRTCQRCLDQKAHYRKKIRRATTAVAPAPTTTEEGRGEDDAVEGPCKARVAEPNNGIWKMMIAYILNP